MKPEHSSESSSVPVVATRHIARRAFVGQPRVAAQRLPWVDTTSLNAESVVEKRLRKADGLFYGSSRQHVSHTGFAALLVSGRSESCDCPHSAPSQQ
jgi:hypothetical protein